jgi:hypothetical protein
LINLPGLFLMQYKIVTVAVKPGFLGTNFEVGAEKLAAAVNEYIAAGWEPQGGVSIGESRGLKTPHLFQAMVKQR